MRELKNNLSRYLVRVGDGEEVIVTDRGRPVARLLSIDSSTDRLTGLVEAGLVRAASSVRRPLPTPIKGVGSVSDLVVDQRR